MLLQLAGRDEKTRTNFSSPDILSKESPCQTRFRLKDQGLFNSCKTKATGFVFNEEDYYKDDSRIVYGSIRKWVILPIDRSRRWFVQRLFNHFHLLSLPSPTTVLSFIQKSRSSRSRLSKQLHQSSLPRLPLSMVGVMFPSLTATRRNPRISLRNVEFHSRSHEIRPDGSLITISFVEPSKYVCRV